ncbi:putative porin [Robiginitalea sp. M366]|uniref:putative porin n=1 Tax=Robiginitalea aestuariiviva TaxID=3036903 RepID=UPI00240E6763|nr:putative porin [Robiginitalea aestuariiviva]MDG1571992.1 putative porin [Robiginitalea aestuariiviva]
MRVLLLLLMGFALCPAWGQDSLPPPKERVLPPADKSGALPARKGEKASENAITIADYKIISHTRDTTVLDTSLTIAKEYKYNYLRRDLFELMPFSNVGQPYNHLGRQPNKVRPYPGMGARARHFNYLEREDMRYYNVATPLSDLMFKTTFEQGQLLDALLTSNFNRRTNVSIAFKGFRSRGKYREDEVTSGNFRATANYVTANGAYRFRAHIAAQDIKGQENGGLLDREGQFESGDTDFSDRSRIDVLYSNVQNELNGKRYYLDQQLRLLGNGTDSTEATSGMFLTHQVEYETKWFQFSQNSNSNAYFGEQLYTPVRDQAYAKTLFNRAGLLWDNRVLGRLEAGVGVLDYRYFFTSILVTDSGLVPDEFQGQQWLGMASWKRDFGAFSLDAKGALGLSGDLTGSYLDASLTVPWGEGNHFRAGLHHSAALPEFNTLLYQSDYIGYNWNNIGVFENEQVQSLSAQVKTGLLGSLKAQLSSMDSYTYFASEATAEQIDAGEERYYVKPFQLSDRITYLRVKYEKELHWRKWALNNTVLYQEVDQPQKVFNLPTLVTRNTLYYSSHVFKKAMYLQTGVTFKYFTEYNMDAYHPLLGEFYVQERESLGSFPMLDFFINARIRQTRIFLKAEHFNSSFSGNNFYSAPGYPYRDFVIRFGLVWNFFS